MRLTAAFALAMVVVLVGAALFVYVRLRADLNEGVDKNLSSRAEVVAALVERSGARLPALSGEDFEPEEVLTQVLSPDGALLAASGGARGPAITPAEARDAARQPMTIDRRVPGIERGARVHARPASARGRRVVVVTGASLEDRDETLNGLIGSFAIGGPIAVLAASGLGYLLASAGLSPVEAMRRRAAGISLDRAGDRLPLPAANDEVRRLAETLNEMLARLEASFERERRFVADASHELRTPLAVLKMELEAMARAGGASDEPRESLAAALAETDHLTQLAEDLLLVARAGDGALPLRPERVDVHDLLEQARHRFADRAREEGRAIVVRAPAGLSAELDPLRLRQALGNLVDNALRHGRGSVTLEGDGEGDVVEIRVRDEGPGFSPELAARAFERFSRGDEARTRGGAGLGLAIVRLIAEAHGGTAAIGEGGAVRLRFPRGGLSSSSHPVAGG